MKNLLILPIFLGLVSTSAFANTILCEIEGLVASKSQITSTARVEVGGFVDSEKGTCQLIKLEGEDVKFCVKEAFLVGLFDASLYEINQQGETTEILASTTVGVLRRTSNKMGDTNFRVGLTESVLSSLKRGGIKAKNFYTGADDLQDAGIIQKAVSRGLIKDGQIIGGRIPVCRMY